MSNIIDQIEKEQVKVNRPQIKVGDTVAIHKEIVEGKKRRIQKFQGLVIKYKNQSIRKAITVRKLVDGVGVEKTFLIYSPLIKKVEVIRKGKVRRARLYYIRQRLGKQATRVKARD